MKILIAVGVLCGIAYSVATSHSAELSGEVFVVTKGQSVVKLALTPISLYEPSVIANHLQAKKEKAALVDAYFKEVSAEAQVAIDEAEGLLAKAKADRDAVFTRYLADIRNEALERAYNAAVARAETLSATLEKLENILSTGKARGRYPYTGIWHFEDLPKPAYFAKTGADGRFAIDAQDGEYVVAAATSRKTPRGDEDYYWLLPVTVKDGASITLANDNLASSGNAQSLIETLDEERTERAANEFKGGEWLVTFVEMKIRERDAEAAAEAKRVAANNAPKTEAAAREMAIRNYPALSDATSPLNREFVLRHKQYRASKPAFFNDPAWPLTLAAEAAASVTEKPVASR